MIVALNKPLSLKKVAENACAELARRIVDGNDFERLVADKIERRFNLVGCTQSHVDALNRRKAEFLAREREQHNRLNPDRLTYLFR